MKSLQDTYAPQGICFGCGPTNEKGLQIKSFAQGQKLVATWNPQPHHQAFEGIVNGGIIGALLDCHSNWTAAWHLKGQNSVLPCTVTANYAIKLLRPTPLVSLELEAQVTQGSEDRATVEATLKADGKICASCQGLFVAVKPGHPAFHRW